MKKYKNSAHIFKTTFVAIAIIIFTSCKSFVEDHEISPNDPQQVTPQLLLTSAQTYMFNTAQGGLARAASIFMQSHGGMDRQYLAFDKYQMTESDVDNEWKDMYAGAMTDMKKIIEFTEKDRPYYAGIAKIMLAHTLGIATDCWGDVPYSEAFKGNEGNLTPKFDTQENVYKSIQQLLDEGIEALSIPKDQLPEAKDNIPSTEDVIFQGDLNKWIIIAHILKARHHNHLSEIDPAGSANLALASVNKALELGASNQSNMKAPFGSSFTNANFWYLFDQNRAGYIGLGKYFIDTLVHSEDPRLEHYAVKIDPDGEYEGYEAGSEGVADNVSLSMAAVTPDMSLDLVTFTELKFIEAEAQFRLGNKEAAATAYNDAINSSLEIASDNPDGVTAYKANYERSGSDLELRDIMFQKYIALFQSIEVWTDYRRTDLPTLKPAIGTTLEKFPRSFPTAQTERINNASNAPQNIGLLKRVWWDKN